MIRETTVQIAGEAVQIRTIFSDVNPTDPPVYDVISMGLHKSWFHIRNATKLELQQLIVVFALLTGEAGAAVPNVDISGVLNLPDFEPLLRRLTADITTYSAANNDTVASLQRLMGT